MFRYVLYFLVVSVCTHAGASERVDDDGFAGTDSCADCHEEQASAWRTSHHFHAMHEATEEFVRGDFNNVTFAGTGESFRFYKAGKQYGVEIVGPEDEKRQHRVAYTFGWTPLQQYLVDVGNGKLQALTVAWDVNEERWFQVNADEPAGSGDWLHWTGGAMNWNTMCADCHSTNVRANYSAETDTFETTFSSVNVGCEACHGPGKAHVELMASDAGATADSARVRADLRLTADASSGRVIGQCAPCHSLREKLTHEFDHTGRFTDHFNPELPVPPAYFADGQIREEVYVYGSFLQSRMHREGVDCNDCHDPHKLELKATLDDNGLCLDCHEASYATRSHHFHEAETEASRCVECHMPGRYFMQIDFRRDHSFRVPRPDLSARFGTPNACNDCHEDRTAEWAAEQVTAWYGKERPDNYAGVLAETSAPALNRLVGDADQPDIVRAAAIVHLDRLGSALPEQALRDDSELMRKAAVRTLSRAAPTEKKTPLSRALTDPIRSVRIGAAAGLAEFRIDELAARYRPLFEKALDEYREYLDVNRYFPAGLMNRGIFLTKRRRLDEAVAAYRKALEKDPEFNPARVNLAHLMNGMGRNEEAHRLLSRAVRIEPDNGNLHYSLALLLSEMDRLAEATGHLDKAAALMPDNARVRYNLAIALQRTGRPTEAEHAWLEAIELAPDNPDYRYGICTLYLQQRQPGKARPHARRLVELRPDSPRARQLLQVIERLSPDNFGSVPPIPARQN